MGKFEVKKSSNNQYYFNLKASNGEIILTSERYVTKNGALNGIESVRVNAPIDSRYDRRTSTDGQYYFVLKAANGEIIGTSERYTTKQVMENGISSVKSNAPTATVVDLT